MSVIPPSSGRLLTLPSSAESSSGDAAAAAADTATLWLNSEHQMKMCRTLDTGDSVCPSSKSSSYIHSLFALLSFDQGRRLCLRKIKGEKVAIPWLKLKLEWKTSSRRWAAATGSALQRFFFLSRKYIKMTLQVISTPWANAASSALAHISKIFGGLFLLINFSFNFFE